MITVTSFLGTSYKAWGQRQLMDSSSLNLRFKEIEPKVYYIGIGASANLSNAAIFNLLPGEKEDIFPNNFIFRNSETKDSVVVAARFRKNSDKVRVVLFNTSDSSVLANLSFQKISVETYKLDAPNDTSIFNKTFLVKESQANEVFKIATVASYLNASQGANFSSSQNSVVDTCDVCMPHDYTCTGAGRNGGGPFNINEVGIWMPCYGITYIRLEDCCKQHDIDMWCENRPLGITSTYLDSNNSQNGIAASGSAPTQIKDSIIEGINKKFYNCLFDKIMQRYREIHRNSTFLCDIIDYPAMLIQAGMVLGFTKVVVDIAVSRAYDESVKYNSPLMFEGKEKGSCLCGGHKKTVICSEHTKVLCEGNEYKPGLKEISSNAPVGCPCTPQSSVTYEFEIVPFLDQPDWQRKWTSSEGITVTLNAQGNKATVTATKNGYVTVIYTDNCGKQQITQKYVHVGGKPAKPILKPFQKNLGEPPCLKPKDDVLLLIDNADKCSKYFWTVTKPGTNYTRISGYADRWTDVIGMSVNDCNPNTVTQVCIKVKAKNECGESEETEYCFDIKPDCGSSMIMKDKPKSNIGLLNSSKQVGKKKSIKTTLKSTQ